MTLRRKFGLGFPSLMGPASRKLGEILNVVSSPRRDHQNQCHWYPNEVNHCAKIEHGETEARYKSAVCTRSLSAIEGGIRVHRPINQEQNQTLKDGCKPHYKGQEPHRLPSESEDYQRLGCTRDYQAGNVS